MVRSYYRYAPIMLLLVLALVIGGCGQHPEAEAPVVEDQPGQAQPAPIEGELPPEEEPWGPSEPTGRTDAAAFKGTDFLTGNEVEFAPGQSDKPAIISFFSPG
jgi:hypothetical protein